MQRLGRYALIEHLGDDPPWRLFRAQTASRGGPYRQPDREVIIRRLMFEPWDYEGRIQLEAARVALSFEHPNIEPVLEWEPGELFCVTELVQGWRLDKLLEALSPMTMTAACHVVRKLCEALGYLHRLEAKGELAEVVPRSPLRPAAVLITTDFEPLIRNPAFAFLDKNQPALASLSPPKDLEHLSPEEVIGLRADHRSDVYHLGLLLYELITATRLFSGRSSFKTIEAIRDDLPTRPSEARAGLPTWLDRVVVKALSKKPHQRHQSTEDLAAELDDIQRSLGWISGKESLRAYLEETGLATSPRPYGLG